MSQPSDFDFGQRRDFYSFAPETLAQELPAFQIVREVGKGRDIRLWACFNDHEYEVVTTTRKDKQRMVQDLP